MPSLRIRVTRTHFLSDCTLSTLEVDLPDDTDGFLPFAFCLEDVDRKVEEDPTRKQKGKTAIPIGTYAVKLYDSPKHGLQTPELVGVPGFSHIQIHAGNTAADTDGCLLPGMAWDLQGRRVVRSRIATDWLVARIRTVIQAGGEVTVEVRRAAVMNRVT